MGDSVRRRLWELPILREPLLQFMVLGALVFLFFALREAGSEPEKARIVVDPALVSRLAALYEKQMGVAPGADQLPRLIDTYIREQILYLEAKRLRLDENDEIVRRRLVQKMEFLASRELKEPTEADLRKYYETHLDEFRQPARVSFEHVFFSPDGSGAADAAARARQELSRLRTQASTHGKHGAMGDFFPLQLNYSRLARLDAVELFGNTPIVDALFTEPVGVWSGPHPSGYGWHLIRVSGRIPEEIPPFEAVIPAVEAAYELDHTTRQTEAAIQEIAKRYEIIRSAPEARK